MKDWKETIREVMQSHIVLQEDKLRVAKHYETRYIDQQQSRLASLRNALDQFEKVVKENEPSKEFPCRFCDKTFYDEYELEVHVNRNHNQFTNLENPE